MWANAQRDGRPAEYILELTVVLEDKYRQDAHTVLQATGQTELIYMPTMPVANLPYTSHTLKLQFY